MKKHVLKLQDIKAVLTISPEGQIKVDWSRDFKKGDDVKVLPYYMTWRNNCIQQWANENQKSVLVASLGTNDITTIYPEKE